MKIIVKATAFERKAGGFRGEAYDTAKRELKQTDIKATLAEARTAARILAHDLCTGRLYRAAPINSKGEFKCNYWAE